MSVEFRILGPMEVVDAGRVVALGGARQRALLAVLLLRANEVVSTDQLIDELWGESPPPTARQTVQVYVSQLRRALAADGGSSGLIETLSPGYVLHVGSGQLDVHRFEEVFARGREERAGGDPVAAAGTLRSGLDLWRGPPLADFAYEDFAQSEIARLEERRLTCVEERVEADLALGRHGDLVAELEALVAAHPVRERLRGQLMVALYGSGRQVEALECYAAGRRALADELGIEPGGALRELERRILNQDPALVPAPAPLPPVWREPVAQARRLWRRDRRMIGAGAAVLTAAVTAMLVVIVRGGESAPAIPGDAVVAIDARGGRASAPVELGGRPSHVAASGDAIWVGGASDGTVRRIDARTNAVVDTVPLGGPPGGMVAADGSLWVTNAFDGTLARIRPETNTIVQTITLPNGPRGIAHGDGAIWVASLYARAITKIDAQTGTKVTTTTVGGSPIAVATGEGAVWVSNESHASVSRIDPKTGRVVQPIGVGNGPGPIAVGAGAVWVANTFDGTVSRIDPGTNAVTATIPVGQAPSGIAASDEAVWVTLEVDGTIARIDPRANSVADRIATGQRPTAVAVDDRRVWVAVGAGAAAHRGGTLRVIAEDGAAGIDQFDYSAVWLRNLTSDGLTAYRRVPGAAGATIVPDLAVSIPSPTDGGRTYTFQLRRGIRYSSGETVAPGDIRRGIERFYRLGVATPLYYDAIVGGAACRARPATCDLSRGIVTDDAGNTVTIHLTRPDPNLLHYLALPFAHAVAPSAPDAEANERGLPATGPYVVASYRPGREIRFVRNPEFREWSRAARPDGYADEIIETGTSERAADEQAAVAAVERDRFDLYLPDRLRPDIVKRLVVQYPDRVPADPFVATTLVVLNTTRPPFDRRDARRAVAHALDRAEMITLGFSPNLAQPACQILPPNFPSHEPYCPYTADPQDDGRWHRPNLDEARRLVASSSTSGATVVVRTWPQFADEAGYVALLLNRLGYRARARVSSPDEWLADAYTTEGDGVQVGLTAWAIDYPAPSTFFEQLRCGSPDPARFCDPAIDRRIDAALAIQDSDPVEADRRWAQIDRSLTDEAAWIAWATPKRIQFLGTRAGNHQFHPVWNTLLDQVWVR